MVPDKQSPEDRSPVWLSGRVRPAILILALLLGGCTQFDAFKAMAVPAKNRILIEHFEHGLRIVCDDASSIAIRSVLATQVKQQGRARMCFTTPDTILEPPFKGKGT